MLLTREKLEQIYAYYKDIETVQPIEEYRKRLKWPLRYTNMITYRFFSYLIDAFGYNALPTVLSHKDFLSVPTRMLYRGSPDINNHANLLVDYDYHKGCGVQGSGLYATDGYWHANQYADENKKCVMAFKLRPDTSIIDNTRMRKLEYAMLSDYKKNSGYEVDDEDLRNEVNETATANYKTFVDFCRAHRDDKGFDKFMCENFNSFDANIALFLGYDAYISGNLIILNRGKIIVSAGEFKRITDESKNYKDGVIDFDKKQDNEFLRE